MIIDTTQLERQLREAKADAHQAKLQAEDRGADRARIFEAGRVAGLAIALETLRLENERHRVNVPAIPAAVSA
jgi:hypothetical protein